jgi:hypothetical protein
MTRTLSLSIASLRAAFPNANLPAETVAIYEAALADLDPADVERAVVARIKTSRFFPTVAEIREQVAETNLALPGPIEAWNQACDSDPGERAPLVTEALRSIGGSWAVRTSENPIAIRAQFLKFYGELRAFAIASQGRTSMAPMLVEAPLTEVPPEVASLLPKVAFRTIA